MKTSRGFAPFLTIFLVGILSGGITYYFLTTKPAQRAEHFQIVKEKVLSYIQ